MKGGPVPDGPIPPGMLSFQPSHGSPAAPLPPFPRRFVNWLPEILFLAATTAAGLAAGGRWLDPSGNTGFSWSLVYRLAQGEILYRDVYVAYGPLSPYLLAGIAQIFGLSAISLLLWNWIPAVVAGVLLLRCARPLLSPLERIALAGLIIAFSLLVPGAGRLIFPYYPGTVHALAFALGALLIAGKPDLRGTIRGWLSGLFAGLAFCSKQEIGLAVMLALLVPLLLRPRQALARGWRIGTSFAAFAGLGLAVALWSAPFDSLRDRSHFWPLDLSPPEELRYLWRVAAGMTGGNRFFDLRETAWQLLAQLVLLAAVAMLATRVRTRRAWVPVGLLAPVLLAAWFFEGYHFTTRLPVALSVVIGFFVAIVGVWKHKLEGSERIVALGIFAGFAGLRAVFSPTVAAHFDGPAHLAASLTWILFLCVLAPALLAPSPRAAALMGRFLGVVVLVASWAAAFSSADKLQAPSNRAVATRQGTVFLDAVKAPFFERLLREVQPGEEALLVPEINAVDVLTGVRSVSPVLDLFPGWLDSSLEEDLLSRFEANPPDVVVLFNRPIAEFGSAPFGEGYGRRLASWIAVHYRPVFSSEVGSVLRPAANGIGGK